MAQREELQANILRLGIYTVATLPPAASYTGAIVYVSNGNGGNPVVCFSNGTNWVNVDDLATAAAS